MRLLLLAAAGCATTIPAQPMELRRVILYQNGIGYFERSGHMTGGVLRLELARNELDDVLKTLTVIDKQGAGVATVDVPTMGDRDRTIGLGVRLSAARAHDLQVSYAVPTPTWKAAYRVVLDARPGDALLQAWAMVNNASQDNWTNVQLTLATGAPMSFALDLHTPEYVKRPDVTGHLVTPTVLGPIDGEQVVDRDGDGLLDDVDRCPEDGPADGCPPVHGRVVISDSALVILERIYFKPASDALAPETTPILDAIAATLRGKPDLERIEIGGFASADESEVWGLSARRAAAVRSALVARGIAAERLVITPYGATRPDGERSRRVEFTIVARGSAKRGLETRAVENSVRPSAVPDRVAGAVRYVVGAPISIPRGATSMISILDKHVRGDDVFLFRPDGNAPGSDRHPFRAVRLANDSGFTLEPGPIAIFSGGTFVGDSLLARLGLGETAWIPYALDGGTQIIVTTNDDEKPVRITAIHHGLLTVENAGVRITRYEIAAGHEAASKLYIRHAKARGFTPKELPPGTQDQGAAYLVPVPLVAGKSSVLAIEEREPRRRSVTLIDARSSELGVYVEGSHLPAEIAERLATAMALRKQSAELEEGLGASRTRIADLAARAEELRQSLRALDRVRGADELRKKLVASLAQATADSDAVARAIGTRTEAIAELRGRLQDAIRELELDVP